MRGGGRLVLGLIVVAIGVTSSAGATSSTRVATSGTALVLDAGHAHTCVVAGTHGVVCWGSNSSGELGRACSYTSCRPVEVPGLTGSAAVAAGDNQTCVLTTAGQVRCWGGCAHTFCNEPTEVPGLGTTTAITAGGSHACGLTAAGGVKCWGNNGNGQLGDGGRCGSVCSQPVDVSDLSSNVVAISAGDWHTCALTVGGAVLCWGWNAEGQLGDGRACGYTECLPTQVVGLSSGVAAIAAGGSHTCALKTSGGVSCWGSSAYGELGGGGQSCDWASCLLPGDVPTLTGGVASISAGEGHTCAVTIGGSVRCWGFDGSGEVSGSPRTCPQSECPVPIDVGGLGFVGRVAAVSAGGDHSCALLASGGVKCWGRNDSEELGDGTKASRVGAVAVVGFGAEYCFVPYIERMGRSAAVRKVRAAGCTTNVRLIYSSVFKKGRVIEQKPYVGTRLRLGGRVHLVVSKGKRKKRA